MPPAPRRRWSAPCAWRPRTASWPCDSVAPPTPPTLPHRRDVGGFLQSSALGARGHRCGDRFAAGDRTRGPAGGRRHGDRTRPRGPRPLRVPAAARAVPLPAHAVPAGRLAARALRAPVLPGPERRARLRVPPGRPLAEPPLDAASAEPRTGFPSVPRPRPAGGGRVRPPALPRELRAAEGASPPGRLAAERRRVHDDGGGLTR